MLPPTSVSGGEQSAGSLVPSSTDATYLEDPVEHQILFGEDAEDLFFNHLDDADFSVLAAAYSPSAIPRQSDSTFLFSSSGLPFASATASRPSTMPDDPFPASSRRNPDPFSPPGPLASPTRLPSALRRVPSSGGGLVIPTPGTVGTSLPSATSDHEAVVSGPQTTSTKRHLMQEQAAPHLASEVPHVSDTPKQAVCLLAVGKPYASSNPSLHVARGGSLADVAVMLSKELNRHGLTPEIDHVVSGERAVQRVKALARHGLRYRMVLLEVEGSLISAASTARDLRVASAAVPIVAVVSPHALQIAINSSSGDPQAGRSSGVSGSPRFRKGGDQQVQSQVLRYFNECLATPVASATVRGLLPRWLLAPPEHVAVAASGGMVAAAAGTAKTSLYGRQPRRFDTAEAWSSFRQQASLESLQASSDKGAAEGSFSSGRSSPLPYMYGSGAWSTAIPLSTVGQERGCLDPRKLDESSGPPSVVESSKQCNEALVSQKGRVFGGGAEDRESPCRLFSSDFAKENAEAQEREFDFVFRHGTVVLRVDEDDFGRIIPVVCSACEYATTHFGDLIGRPLRAMFDGAATNKTTAANILQHIEDGETDSICSYINLKSDGCREMASFISIRPLSKRPQRGPSHERLLPWYVLLKVCLPSTIGLIKEPGLLDKMYSRTAMAIHASATKKASKDKSKPASKTRSKPAAKRSTKRVKASPPPPSTPSVAEEQEGGGSDAINTTDI